MASEVCLIDHDANKASAEAEDIQHVGFFLGCPLVTGTSGTNIYVYFYSNFSSMLSKHGSTNFGIISSAWKWRIDKSVREIPEILGSWGNVSVDVQRVENNGRKGKEGRDGFLGPAQVSRSSPALSFNLVAHLHRGRLAERFPELFTGPLVNFVPLSYLSRPRSTPYIFFSAFFFFFFFRLLLFPFFDALTLAVREESLETFFDLNNQTRNLPRPHRRAEQLE